MSVEATDRPRGSRWARLRALLPEVWALVRPRRRLLLAGAALMALNRVSRLVLPASTKVLLDDVVGQRRLDLLAPAPRLARSRRLGEGT